MVDFEQLKAMAKELRCAVPDLLALARQNDPFYVGTPTDLAMAEWFAGIWQRGAFSQGAHLRRLHYWAVSQGDLQQHNSKPYENTEECWQYLLQASKKARYLGLVDIADIADHKNPDPTIYSVYDIGPAASVSIDIPELTSPWVSVNVRRGADLQPYHLEVWVEKSTMDDVLLPICRRYGANLVTGEGEMSITSVYDFTRRLRQANKPARLFYISDFDPAGHSIPRAVARKIEWMLARQGLTSEVKLAPLALRLDHVQRYHLPRTPIKESERRGASFEERYGMGAVELDALEALRPGTLADMVGDALKRYHDAAVEADAQQKASDLRQAIHAEITQVTARYAREIEALEGMAEALRIVEQTFDVSPYRPQRSTRIVDDAGQSWLFDSQRTYLAQIEAYKDYAHGHPDEDVN
jgi:hypothetical protein